eukprot:5582888-Amphidinium_carterae.1
MLIRAAPDYVKQVSANLKLESAGYEAFQRVVLAFEQLSGLGFNCCDARPTQQSHARPKPKPQKMHQKRQQREERCNPAPNFEPARPHSSNSRGPKRAAEPEQTKKALKDFPEELRKLLQ